MKRLTEYLSEGYFDNIGANLPRPALEMIDKGFELLGDYKGHPCFYKEISNVKFSGTYEKVDMIDWKMPHAEVFVLPCDDDYSGDGVGRYRILVKYKDCVFCTNHDRPEYKRLRLSYISAFAGFDRKYDFDKNNYFHVIKESTIDEMLQNCATFPEFTNIQMSSNIKKLLDTILSIDFTDLMDRAWGGKVQN